MSGEWTDKQVFQEFLGTFDSPNNKDYIVSKRQQNNLKLKNITDAI